MKKRASRYIILKDSKLGNAIKNNAQMFANQDLNNGKDFTESSLGVENIAIINRKNVGNKSSINLNETIEDTKKINYIKKIQTDEQQSVGSGGAFSQTEELLE